MTLRQRVADLQQRNRINICISTLRDYYLRHNIKFKHVDLIATNKIARRDDIQADQLRYVAELFFARHHQKRVYYFDETSYSLWNPLLRRTWTDNTIRLPY